MTFRESIVLWVLAVGVCCGFFILGLWLGLGLATNEPGKPADAQAAGSKQQAQQSTSRLDLANPVESNPDRSSSASSAQTAPPKTSDAASAKPPATARTTPPRIEIEPPVRETSAAKPPAATSTSPARKGPFFTIQLGALKTEAEARRLATQLQSAGYTGIIDKPSGRDTFYRVRVGNYETREAARTAEAHLKDAGFKTFIKKMDGRSAN